MKRIKIMMLSLALFAVIGGALAFKAKFDKIKLCYTTTNINTTCEVLVAEVNPTEQGPRFTYYTTTPLISEGQPVCFTWDEEHPEITTKLSCTTPATLTTAEF